MLLVKPGFEFLKICLEQEYLHLIERAGRVCYKSEDKMTDSSAKGFIKRILKSGHESVIEHSLLSVKFIVDRGISHELVRHRLCAFSQESTRYCNYSGGITFIIPPWINIEPGECNAVPEGASIDEAIWLNHLLSSTYVYTYLLQEKGWSPQQARSVLPNSLKTELVMTANFREWRHIFKLRTSPRAHPQMREVMIPLLAECKKLLPTIFDDIT